MSKYEWIPVEDGTIECDCEEGCGCSLTTYKGTITLENEAGYWSVELPIGFAVCRRVEPEPITPDALEQEGWHFDDSIGSEIISFPDDPDEDAILDKAWTLELTEHSFARRAKTMHVYFSEYLSGETISVLVVAYSERDDMEMAFDGCTTMPQLRALIEMLGGE